jgi:SOS-response transcriptional repressor LexA
VDLLLPLSNTFAMAKGRIMAALGRRLVAAREARGISQADLARALGVSRSAAAQWESGLTAPSTDNLAAAATEVGVAFEWLATGRGDRALPVASGPELRRPVTRSVPVISWVSAGRLAESGMQIPVEDVPLLAFADLGRGDFFALKVQGDSMDRLSPDGSIIVVNRADRTLVSGKAYVFSRRGEATYKLWEPDPPHLAPFSTNPANKAIFVKGKRDFEVLGRVKRTLLDL